MQFLSNERFGSGVDGNYAPSTGTDAPIDSACTGTINTTSLSATNVSFATGQLILIHQTRGTGAGQWELNRISGYTAGTITTKYALTYGYVSGAQVLVMPQYASGNIAGGVTITTKAWNGTVGGIYAKYCNGTFTIAGTLTGTGKGFRAGVGDSGSGQQGEGTTGAGGTDSTLANGSGAGGGRKGTDSGHIEGGNGGGGGNATTGTTGSTRNTGTGGTGGTSSGNAGLTLMTFGGGGGAGGANWNGSPAGSSGAIGGGILVIISKNITVTGNITNGGNSTGNSSGGVGGAGGAGSTLLKGQTLILGSSKVTAPGGTGGTCTGSFGGTGGAGSVGRIHADYSGSISGSTSPTLDSTQDRSLADAWMGGMI